MVKLLHVSLWGEIGSYLVDFAHLGSTVSVQSFIRIGSAVSVRGNVKSGSTHSVLGRSEFGSFIGAQRVVRLGNVVSIYFQSRSIPSLAVNFGLRRLRKFTLY